MNLESEPNRLAATPQVPQEEEEPTVSEPKTMTDEELRQEILKAREESPVELLGS